MYIYIYIYGQAKFKYLFLDHCFSLSLSLCESVITKVNSIKQHHVTTTTVTTYPL